MNKSAGPVTWNNTGARTRWTAYCEEAEEEMLFSRSLPRPVYILYKPNISSRKYIHSKSWFNVTAANGSLVVSGITWRCSLEYEWNVVNMTIDAVHTGSSYLIRKRRRKSLRNTVRKLQNTDVLKCYFQTGMYKQSVMSEYPHVHASRFRTQRVKYCRCCSCDW